MCFCICVFGLLPCFVHWGSILINTFVLWHLPGLSIRKFLAIIKAIKVIFLKTDAEFFYKRTSPYAGYCLIINNIKFDNKFKSIQTSGDRFGSEIDAESLSRFFKEKAKYEVEVKTNLKAEQMNKILRELSRLEGLARFDQLVVIIMSHGDQRGKVDVIFGSDWEYMEKSHVYNIFNNENCIYMLKKPKIFIFVSCRGDGMDYGVSLNQPDESLNTVCDRSMEFDILKFLPNAGGFDGTVCNILIPRITDTFIVHSTLPCHASSRAYFCQDLVDVLKENFLKHDLQTIINLLNERLLSKIDPTYRIVQCAHYEALGTTKMVKFS